jgi:hypothetical protein
MVTGMEALEALEASCKLPLVYFLHVQGLR